jgi:hypothetical protein
VIGLILMLHFVYFYWKGRYKKLFVTENLRTSERVFYFYSIACIILFIYVASRSFGMDA